MLFRGIWTPPQVRRQNPGRSPPLAKRFNLRTDNTVDELNKALEGVRRGNVANSGIVILTRT